MTFKNHSGLRNVLTKQLTTKRFKQIAIKRSGGEMPLSVKTQRTER